MTLFFYSSCLLLVYLAPITFSTLREPLSNKMYPSDYAQEGNLGHTRKRKRPYIGKKKNKQFKREW